MKEKHFQTIKESELTNHLSKNLKQLRLSKNPPLSQERLANNLGTTREAISRFEQGNRIPTVCTLLNLSRFFQIPMEDLLLKSPDAGGSETNEDITSSNSRNNRE